MIFPFVHTFLIICLQKIALDGFVGAFLSISFLEILSQMTSWEQVPLVLFRNPLNTQSPKKLFKVNFLHQETSEGKTTKILVLSIPLVNQILSGWVILNKSINLGWQIVK